MIMAAPPGEISIIFKKCPEIAVIAAATAAAAAAVEPNGATWRRQWLNSLGHNVCVMLLITANSM